MTLLTFNEEAENSLFDLTVPTASFVQALLLVGAMDTAIAAFISIHGTHIIHLKGKESIWFNTHVTGTEISISSWVYYNDITMY